MFSKGCSCIPSSYGTGSNP